jgi:26S proteasome regulatory subunit N5
MRIMAKYYTRVRTQKMAELLDLTKDEAEQFLSNLVSNKTISAKIDRLQDIVTFQQNKSPQDILNEWSVNLNSLMTIINKTCHLINKEETVHAVRS